MPKPGSDAVARGWIKVGFSSPFDLKIGRIGINLLKIIFNLSNSQD
jgi:hypothetical protein